MAIKICPNCKGNDLEFDNQMGHVVCIDCASVLQQNIMVSDVTFSETSKGAAIADGFTLKLGQVRAKSKTAFGAGSSSSLRSHQESSEATRERGHQSIERAGNQQGINMGPNLIEKAKRVFDIALTAKYTKGRKTACVVAACCYITCRMEKTSHMMIDFADAFSTNVYKIGAIFLQLRIMFLEKSGIGSMPLVDPGLYMARFADKLDFGAETAKVVANANRLAARMDRDWIVQGRRPAGVCAASLFIAARMSGFKRTVREIVLVVKICEGTLRQRLKEFEVTDSGKLSKLSFETSNLKTCSNPPSFEKEQLSARSKCISPVPAPVPAIDISTQVAPKQSIDQDSEEEEVLLNEINGYIESSAAFGKIALTENEDTLSDLDDDPEVLNSIAMSDDETDFKRELWMAENHDWVAKQETNELTGLKKEKKPESRKRARKDEGRGGVSGSAAEATRKLLESKPAISRKINYDVLNALMRD